MAMMCRQTWLRVYTLTRAHTYYHHYRAHQTGLCINYTDLIVVVQFIYQVNALIDGLKYYALTPLSLG